MNEFIVPTLGAFSGCGYFCNSGRFGGLGGGFLGDFGGGVGWFGGSSGGVVGAVGGVWDGVLGAGWEGLGWFGWMLRSPEVWGCCTNV